MSSRIILGTAQFGLSYGVNNTKGKPDITKVHSMLRFAYKKGVSCLDTAEAYGDAAEVIGQYHRMTDSLFDINTKFVSNGSLLRYQLDSSIAKMSCKQINVCFFHDPKDLFLVEDNITALLEAKAAGKIKKIGVSVYDNDEFAKACEHPCVDVIQFPYNLLDNYTQRIEIIKVAKSKGIELHARSVFLQGLFAMQDSELPAQLKPLIGYLSMLRSIAHEYDFSIMKMALLYALNSKEIDHVLIGVDTLDQLQNNLRDAKGSLPAKAIAAINDVIVEKVDLLYPKNWS
jgi:aryl-alcohol dehydrogenase-like predicted oxidoreductase